MKVLGAVGKAACAVCIASCGRSELAPLFDSGSPSTSIAVDSAIDSILVEQGLDQGAVDTAPDFEWRETIVPDIARDQAVDSTCTSGRWTFGPIVTYATPNFSGAENGAPVLGAGDFDGDGTLDLIGLLSTPQAGAVWSNLGAGTFALRTTFAVDAQVFAVAVGDFNRDGLADFVLGFADNLNAVEVFTNQGDGSFAITSTFTVNDGAWEFAVADFNGDGAPDLAIADGFGELEIALNRGDGIFPSVVTNSTEYLVEEMAVGDINHDGFVDIVSTSAPGESDSIGVILNQGDGTFTQAITYVGGCDGDTGPIALGDFNGDGWLDVTRSCWQGAQAVAVRTNNGDGTFGGETTYGAGSWPWGIAVDHFLTTDGPLDIAAAPVLGADFGDSCINVLPGVGDGTFGKMLGAGSSGTAMIIAGDFNGDGHADIAFSAYNSFGVLFFVCQ